MIFLGDGLKSEQLHPGSENQIAAWVQTQAYDWYKHLMSRHLPVENGDLQVIKGTQKTSYWLTTTFSQLASNVNDFSFTVKYYPKPTGNMNTRCLYEHTGAFWTHVLSGPDETEAAALRSRLEQKLRNQAIFVTTMTVTLSDDEWARLQKEVKLKQPAGQFVPRPRPAPSHTSAPAPPGVSKSVQANAPPKKSRWMPRKRPHVPSDLSVSTSSIMMLDEARSSSEDDYGWLPQSSPVSSDDCMPDDEPEKSRDQQSQWTGIVRCRICTIRRNPPSYENASQEKHPSRLLNQKLVKKVRNPSLKLCICQLM